MSRADGKISLGNRRLTVLVSWDWMERRIVK